MSKQDLGYWKIIIYIENIERICYTILNLIYKKFNHGTDRYI